MNTFLPVQAAGTFDIANRVFILTGGAGLLGSHYVPFLSAQGAHVVVADKDGEAAEQVANSVHGAMALAIETDVTDRDSTCAMVEKTLRTFGRLDGLINNAALDPKFDPQAESQRNQDSFYDNSGAFEIFPLELWNQSLAVDLTGMFLCTQAVAPALLAHGHGVVINVSSIYGMVAPDQSLYERTGSLNPAYKPVTYSVTKSAVLGFSRYLATYWGHKGIRVNTLTLGGVYNDHDEEFTMRYNARAPLGRMADKDDFYGALQFLLSDASQYMTGANLVVDGGWTAW
jgi:2-deoxy-D-gluconate 3-dehydrogenase